MTFERGQQVSTPMGTGVVIYQRMAPPTYTEAEAVSVRLTARETDVNYSGTIFPAAEVHPV